MNRPKLQILGVMAIVAALLLLVVPVSAKGGGSVLRVGPGQEYTTIQAAVDDAKPDSKILVYPMLGPPDDFYFETVTVRTNSLKILAQGSGVKVVADSSVACFDVKADHVVIRGFDLTGPQFASGIQFEGSHNTFEDNAIHDLDGPGVNGLVCNNADGGSDHNQILNNAISGADVGIAIQAGLPHAVNKGNIIQGNVLEGTGQTAIAITNGVGFLVSDNRILGASFGSCVVMEASVGSEVALRNHRIVQNQIADCAGHGIDIDAGDTSFETNKILDNDISDAGCGISFESAPSASMTGNLIKGNHVYQNGAAGICLGYGADRNKVFANDASDNFGDGIVVQGDGNRITGNEARSNDGTGIVMVGNSSKVIKNTALENEFLDLSDLGTDNTWRSNTYETVDW